jgi:hypothetical protein
MISTQMCYLCPRTLRYLSPKSKHPQDTGEGVKKLGAAPETIMKGRELREGR